MPEGKGDASHASRSFYLYLVYAYLAGACNILSNLKESHSRAIGTWGGVTVAPLYDLFMLFPVVKLYRDSSPHDFTLVQATLRLGTYSASIPAGLTILRRVKTTESQNLQVGESLNL